MRERSRGTMTNIKISFALLAAVVGVVAFGAAQASASSAPIVITYEKRCSAGHCEGTTGNGGMITMDVTGFQPTGPKVVQLTMTETITGSVSLDAELSGHFSPAGFIVLNGTVTGGELRGVRIHQRSNFAGMDGSKEVWIGELRLMPASA
jgi:hypothetical protein